MAAKKKRKKARKSSKRSSTAKRGARRMRLSTGSIVRKKPSAQSLAKSGLRAKKIGKINGKPAWKLERVKPRVVRGVAGKSTWWRITTGWKDAKGVPQEFDIRASQIPSYPTGKKTSLGPVVRIRQLGVEEAAEAGHSEGRR